jgi:hypothetical protein
MPIKIPTKCLQQQHSTSGQYGTWVKCSTNTKKDGTCFTKTLPQHEREMIIMEKPLFVRTIYSDSRFNVLLMTLKISLMKTTNKLMKLAVCTTLLKK